MAITGHAITPAYVLQSPTDKKGPSNQSIFISQELWFVDLDNHQTSEEYPLGPDPNLSLEDILGFCSQYKLHPFVAYETLSSIIEAPRFRVGFRSTEVIKDLDKRNRYVCALISLFEQRYRYVDIHCKDLGRFFYGTTIDKIDSAWLDDEAEADINHLVGVHHSDVSSSNDGYSKDRIFLPLLHPSCDDCDSSSETNAEIHHSQQITNHHLAGSSSHDRYSKDRIFIPLLHPSYEECDDNEIESEGNPVGNIQSRYHKASSSNDGYSKGIQTCSLLHPSCEAFIISEEVDVRYHAANCVPFEAFTRYRLGENFCCEFHQDSIPSARIEAVTGGKYHGEYRYACYSSDCHVYLSPVEYVVKSQSCDKAEALTYLLSLRDMPVCPEFWENLHSTHHDACKILGIDRGNGKGRNGSDQIMVSITRAAKLGVEVDGEVFFPLADKSIGKDLIARGVVDVSPVGGNIQPKRVRLCYLGLVRPVDDMELGRINPAGLKHFRDLQARNRRSRRCNWYAISTAIPLEEQLRKACLIAKDLSQGGSAGPMTQDVVSMNAGTEKANEIFVQDQGNELSRGKGRLVEKFSSELGRQVEETGWSTKQRVRDAVFHRNYGVKARTLNQCWYSIIKENGYSLVLINQPLREVLNIVEGLNRGSKIVVERSLVEEVESLRAKTN